MQEVIDLLSSDVRIVDSTSRTVDSGRGVQTLRFPGHLMPDGKDFLGEAPEKLDPTILRGWCNSVRGEFDARQSRKESAQVRPDGVHPESSPQGDKPSGEPISTGAGAEGNGAGSEASLDEYLQAEVAKWAKHQRRAAEDITALGEQIDARVREHDAYAALHLKAQKVLAFYLAQEDTGIAPEDL